MLPDQAAEIRRRKEYKKALPLVKPASINIKAGKTLFAKVKDWRDRH